MRQLPCWSFIYDFPSVSLFSFEIKQNISEMPIPRANAGVPAATAAASIAGIPTCVFALALAKLLVVHVCAGTLLHAEQGNIVSRTRGPLFAQPIFVHACVRTLRSILAAVRSLPFAASLDEGEELFLGHLHLAETLCALLLHAAA